MKSRYIEVKKLADDTYNQYGYYGTIIANPIIGDLRMQKDFIGIDPLLSDEEKTKMIHYINSCIIDILIEELY